MKTKRYLIGLILFLTFLNNLTFSDNQETWNNYIQVGTKELQRGKYKEALNNFEKSLQIALKLWGEINVNTATSYSWIGRCHDSLGKYDQALNFYNKALTIQLKKLGEDHSDVAATYNNIASIYASTGQYLKALDYFNKCLNIELKKLGGNHPDVANTYNNIGNVYSRLGDYAKTLDYYKKSLDISLKKLGADSLLISFNYNNIAGTYLKIGQFEKAIDFLNKSLRIRIKKLGLMHIDVATVYNNIGYFYSYIGKYVKANEYYKKSLTIAINKLGDEHPSISTIFNNIGSNYIKTGNYVTAIEYYNKSLQIRLKKFGENHPDIASNYNNIAEFYSIVGQYYKALEYYNKSLIILKKKYGQEHPYIASSFNNIGIVYNQLNKFEIANEYYNKALSIQLEKFGKDHIDVARTYNNIGNNYDDLREYHKALEIYNKSLQILLKKMGEEHPYIATNYINIGFSYFNTGQYKKAINYYNKSLSIRLKKLGLKHPLLTINYKYIGLAYNEMGEFEKAIPFFKKAESIYEKVRGELFSSESRTQFRKKYIDLYNFIISTLFKLKKYPEAYQYAEKASARGMLETLNRTNIFNNYNFKEKSRDIVNQLLNYESGYNAINGKLINELQKSQTNSDIIKNLKEQLEKLENNIIQTEKKLFAIEPKLKELLNPRIVNHIEAQKSVNNKTAILQYFTTEKEAYLFILYKAKLKMISIGKASEINNLVNKFIPQLSLENENNRGVRIVERRTEDRSDTAELNKKLFDTLLKEGIKGILEGTNLLIIPSGTLAFLPFETLIMPDNRFLVNSYRISYTPSMSIYNTIRKEKLNNKYPLLAFGNAIYETNTQDRENIAYLRSSNTNALENYTSSALRSGSGIGDAIQSALIIKNLPATLDEVKALSRIYYNNEESEHIYTGIDVCEELINKLNQNRELEKYNIIHFATHGMVNRRVPELTSIILTLPNDDIREKIKKKFNVNIVNDGFLTVLKVLNLNIKSEIITLSACQTGLGKIEQGEGLIGLTRAFLFAGTRKVIVSLWEVGDVSTMVFMSEFYKYYKKTGDAILSLNRVKQDFISGKKYTTKDGLVSFKHPFFWAAFVLYGK